MRTFTITQVKQFGNEIHYLISISNKLMVKLREKNKPFIRDFYPRTSKGGGGSNGPPIGFSDLKFEAFKQSK